MRVGNMASQSPRDGMFGGRSMYTLSVSADIRHIRGRFAAMIALLRCLSNGEERSPLARGGFFNPRVIPHPGKRHCYSYQAAAGRAAAAIAWSPWTSSRADRVVSPALR